MRSFLLVFLGLVGCLPAGDQPPARWSYIHAAIIQPACATAGCHSSLAALAGVNLAGSEGAYTKLTARICGEPAGDHVAERSYVTPFAADYSQLVYQLRGADSEGRPYRDVMPPDTRLPAQEIELVVRWIDDGAACD